MITKEIDQLIKKLTLKDGDVLICHKSLMDDIAFWCEYISTRKGKKYPDVDIIFVDDISKIIKKEMQ